MTFDPSFRLYTLDPQRRPLETIDDMRAELAAELAARRELYPRLARKGRMSHADVERELRVMAALARQPGATATWAEKVHCLRREIAIRRVLYPRWILAGRITGVEADRKLELIESVHASYWCEYHNVDPERIAAHAALRRAAA